MARNDHPIRPASRRPYRWTALTLCVALAFMQSGAPTLVAYAQAASRTRAEVATQTKAALAALAEVVDDLPRETFDVDAALAAAGGTPEGAFAWVRDTTRLVPYDGSLRGPVGVLLDGSGNSLDRALLIVALVEAAGGTARLAHGTLSDTELALATATTAAPPVVRPIDDGVDAVAAAEESGLDLGFLAEAATAAEVDAALVSTGLAERVDAQADFLLDVAPELATADADASDSLRDHWWAQYQVAGGWVNLDPTLPDAEPGTTLTTATEHMPASELPQAARHTLRLEVVLECSLDGALSEHVLTTSEALDAGSLLGKRLAVQHVPVALGDGIDPDLDQDAVRDLVLDQDTWFPVISLGGQSTFDLQFDSDCALGEASQPWLGTAVVGALEGATDLLGGLFGPAPEDAVTALFLDYHLNVPGTGELTIRRPVFDVLGAAARASGTGEPTVDPAERLGWRLALLGETEVLATGGRLSQPYVTDLLTRALLGQRGAIEALADANTASEAEAAAAAAGAAVSDAGEQLPSALYGLALARQPDHGSDVYIAGLSIVNRHDQVAVSDDGALRRLQAIDIVANPVGSVDGSVAAVVRQGVRDTNAETLLSRTLCGSPLTAEFCTTIGNPADDLARTVPDPGGWLTLRSTEELAAAGLNWAPDASASLRADLEAGYLVVVPTAPGGTGAPASWWRIDPTTGTTLGVNELGWGPSMVAYALIVNFIGFAFCEVGAISGGAAIGGTVLCTFGFATGTGAILAGAGGVAGALMIASAILYGLGGLGYPKD